MIEGVQLKQPNKRRELDYWPDEIFQLLVRSPEKHKTVEYYEAQSIEVKSGAGDLPNTPTSFAQGLIQVRHCTDVQQGDLTRLGLSLLEHEFVTAEDAARADREEHQVFVGCETDDWPKIKRPTNLKRVFTPPPSCSVDNSSLGLIAGISRARRTSPPFEYSVGRRCTLASPLVSPCVATRRRKATLDQARRRRAAQGQARRRNLPPIRGPCR